MNIKIKKNININTAKILKGVLNIEKKSFPKGWQYDDAKDYYMKALESKDNINIFAVCDDKIVGYTLAVPFSYSYNELAPFDKKIKKLKSGIYLETIGVLPNFQGMGIAKKMMLKINNEAKKKNL